MNQKIFFACILSAVLIFGFMKPVSAFSFELYYFETDKLVYEVGETVNMVAKILADFSEEGWCHLSFGVVTELGPVYNEDYFISSSSEIRFFNSSYIINPDDTMPGPNGTQAFAVFDIEIFDMFSQGDGDTIEINITRGHLTATPATPLILNYGQNTTIDLIISSIHKVIL